MLVAQLILYFPYGENSWPPNIFPAPFHPRDPLWLKKAIFVRNFWVKIIWGLHLSLLAYKHVGISSVIHPVKRLAKNRVIRGKSPQATVHNTVFRYLRYLHATSKPSVPSSTRHGPVDIRICWRTPVLVFGPSCRSRGWPGKRPSVTSMILVRRRS